MHELLLRIIHFPDQVYNRIMLQRKHVQTGSDLRITGKLYCHGSGHIVIGNNVVIHSSPNRNATAGGYATHLGTGSGGSIIIGDNVGISHAAITAYTSVIIEDNVLIGSNCMIADTDFHSLKVEERLVDDGGGVISKPIKICKNAFIGARSIILKGVTIGQGSIVGAGSVVTKDIPKNEVWGGSPAHFIRTI